MYGQRREERAGGEEETPAQWCRSNDQNDPHLSDHPWPMRRALRQNDGIRGHPGSNRGPLDLQSNALPLSYIYPLRCGGTTDSGEWACCLPAPPPDGLSLLAASPPRPAASPPRLASSRLTSPGSSDQRRRARRPQRGRSSDGRALALHVRGTGIDTPHLQFLAPEGWQTAALRTALREVTVRRARQAVFASGLGRYPAAPGCPSVRPGKGIREEACTAGRGGAAQVSPRTSRTS